MLKNTFLARSTECLRMGHKETRKVMSNILAEFEKEEKSSGFSGWTEQLQISVVRRYIKSLQKAIEQFGTTATELAAGYSTECDILLSFLPGFLNEEDTNTAVQEYLTNAKSLGHFIGLVMKSDHKSTVDPSTVRKIGQEFGLK